MYTVRTCVTNRIQPHSHTYHIHRQHTWAHTNTHTSYTDRHMSNIQHHHDLNNDMCGNAPTLTANTTLSLTAPPTALGSVVNMHAIHSHCSLHPLCFQTHPKAFLSTQHCHQMQLTVEQCCHSVNGKEKHFTLCTIGSH